MIDFQIKADNSSFIKVDIQRQLTLSGKPSNRFTGYISHSGLGVRTKLVDTNLSVLQQRLNDQARDWNEEWSTLEKNKEANSRIEKIKSILYDGVKQEITVEWEKVKDKTVFPKEKPAFKESEPILEETHPKPNFLDKLLKSRYERLLNIQKQNYQKNLLLWNNKKKIYENERNEWEKEKGEFEKRQKKYNENIENLKIDYEKLKTKAIEWYSQILLEQSSYTINFKKKIAIEYKAGERFLIVEYFLPSLEDLPKIKETKYLKSTGEKKKLAFSDHQFNALYEEVLYQTTLRTIYELFKADVVGAIGSVIFNGWVNNLNKAIGKRQDVCILSLMVNRDEFMDVNLIEVDPKACFKRFKGVSASALSSITPIPPILKINKKDKRFIEAEDVAQNIDDSTNVAAMDWQEFEQLVREIFEREYSSVGGEVKVTQSSRDKGVDAIAFDPDPIRGGKVIIQAKRYTNTVNIESVRALYGIMQDEGAMKGILVTTSDFGSDAYSFAKDKPIALLNGANLLAMFQKHGFRGKIDLSEAKKMIEE